MRNSLNRFDNAWIARCWRLLSSFSILATSISSDNSVDFVPSHSKPRVQLILTDVTPGDSTWKLWASCKAGPAMEASLYEREACLVNSIHK